MRLRGRRFLMLFVAGWSLALSAAGPAAAQSIEYAVKANYLVRFAAFVDWPATAFSTPEGPFWLCVLGKDPFGATLERATDAQSAHGRAVKVRRLPAAGASSGCHMVYVGQGGAASLQQGIKSQSGLLVVTDSAVSPQRGAIHFVVSNGNVRFHIDARAAARNNIAIGSRLLNLALTVRRP